MEKHAGVDDSAEFQAAKGGMGRRQFLTRLGAGGGTLAMAAGLPRIVAPRVTGRVHAASPNGKVNLGCIGTGGQGRSVMRHFVGLENCRVTAVCDVKEDDREEARRLVNEYYEDEDCAAYNDHEELLARDDIDAVLIASTDHWHLIQSVDAARAGKDIYLEKPVGMSIEEVQLLREAVQKHDVVFQFGTQQRSDARFRRACELVRNGAVGALHTVKVSVPAGAGERSGLEHIEGEEPPGGIDYDRWLGPAPERPYHPQRVITPYWYHNSDHSLGFIAGWGIHHIDIAQWGMDTELTGPKTVRGKAAWAEWDALCDNPLGWDITYEYANGVTVSFTDSETGHRQGVTFEGEDGWIWVSRGAIEAEPAGLLEEELGEDAVRLYESNNHAGNFIECVLERKDSVSPMDVSACSDIVCQLGWIAVQLNRDLDEGEYRELAWDPETECFPDEDAPNRLMRRAMRPPWKLPAV